MSPTLRSSALLLLLIVVPAGRCADPTDNPIATFYDGPEGYPAWTDTFNWGKKYQGAGKGRFVFGIGFRVERRIGEGKWQTIAYRPPHLEDDSENPRAWVDYTAPTGKELTYRVVAVNSADDDEGASAATETVRLGPAPRTAPVLLAPVLRGKGHRGEGSGIKREDTP